MHRLRLQAFRNVPLCSIVPPFFLRIHKSSEPILCRSITIAEQASYLGGKKNWKQLIPGCPSIVTLVGSDRRLTPSVSFPNKRGNMRSAMNCCSPDWFLGWWLQIQMFLSSEGFPQGRRCQPALSLSETLSRKNYLASVALSEESLWLRLTGSVINSVKTA